MRSREYETGKPEFRMRQVGNQRNSIWAYIRVRLSGRDEVLYGEAGGVTGISSRFAAAVQKVFLFFQSNPIRSARFSELMSSFTILIHSRIYILKASLLSITEKKMSKNPMHYINGGNLSCSERACGSVARRIAPVTRPTLSLTTISPKLLFFRRCSIM